MLPAHSPLPSSTSSRPPSLRSAIRSAIQEGVTDLKSAQLTDFTIKIPSSSARVTGPEPGPSKWRTPEFSLYAAVFVLVVPVVVYWPMRLSSRKLRLIGPTDGQRLI